ncbi:dTDP-glucose 4,6-dehydratase [Simkania sp.]|uniref:dTDP-glucose 4,6-dehydratase n=1 Tax=Simkania sp. TaxID=34094 RepID=UPI003B526338
MKDKMQLKFALICFLLIQVWGLSPFTLHAKEKTTLLVTGGAGFIGSNFVEHMFETHSDYHIIVLDVLTYSANVENIPKHIRNSPRFSLIQGSICDEELINQLMANSDFVVHFAAESDVTRSIVDDRIFYETNVMGTRNLLHHLVKYRDSVKRFIHISSSEVYGTCEDEELTEESVLSPRSPYAASKVGAEASVFAYGCTYDLPVAILRFFNNYGPRQHPEKVVAKFIIYALKDLPIPVHGTGEQSRDWVYVKDTARAIDAALHVSDFETIRNQIINCGTGRDISIATIAKTICRSEGVPLERVVFTADRPGQVQKHLSSTAKAKKLLGWEPLTSFEQGIETTLNWYRNNPMVPK